MGQPNAERIQYRVQQLITSAVNDDIQNMTDTSCFKRGDGVRVLLVDENGCTSGVAYADLTVSGICPDEAIIFDQAVDLTGAPSGFSYYLENCETPDVQSALDRIWECYTQLIGYRYELCEDITAFSVDDPVSGQGTYTVGANALCFGAGDEIQIICDDGIAGSGTVISRDITTGEIVLDTSIDLTAKTGCKLCNISLTLDQVIGRLKDVVADIPVCNEDLDDGDCDNLAFEIDSVFIDNSEKIFLDGIRKTRGTCGTRAALTDGAGNSEWTATSLVMGTLGNGVSLELVDPLANNSPLAITLSGSISNGTKLISVSLETDGGGSIITTAEELADALNADADVKRLVQVLYGGDGSGVVATLASTPLAGGLNDGTKDYCTLEQVDSVTNSQTGTGYKWVSFHVRDNSFKNRLHSAPRDDEDLVADYSTSP